MTKNMVLLCNENSLFAYNRANDGTIQMSKKATVFSSSPFTDFVCCNDKIISGHKDGRIRHWEIKLSDEKNYSEQLLTHCNVHYDIRHIDATSEHIISGSLNSIKIHKYTHENSYDFEKFYNTKYEVQSMLFDPTGTQFAVSTFTKYPQHLLSHLIYDINKNYPVINKEEDCSNYRLKLGAFQLLWEDSHTILMCYDSYINKMDTRTSEIVRTLNCSSQKGILTCFTTDNLYTILTGTNHNEIFLWDQRQNAHIQTYKNRRKQDGIYSVQFDSAHLYVGTGNNLFQYDFKERDNSRKKKYILSNFF
ncbi:uncharacterized protein [Linepithema humile]